MHTSENSSNYPEEKHFSDKIEKKKKISYKVINQNKILIPERNSIKKDRLSNAE